MKRYLLSLFCALLAGLNSAFPQISVNALFEYPEAPDTITSLESRSNYIVTHFWDPMNWKSQVVDQSALNHAFDVYCTPMRWASKEVTDASTSALLKRLEKSPVLLYQFLKAAEDNLYGPRASMWIDDVYMRYLESVLQNKKIAEARKTKYRKQLASLQSSRVESKFPALQLLDSAGKASTLRFSPEGFNLIVFTFANDGSSLAKTMKLQSSEVLKKLTNKGVLKPTSIVVYRTQERLNASAAPIRNAGWEAYRVLEPENVDLRNQPAIYLVDSNGVIARKNMSVEETIDLLSTLDTDTPTETQTPEPITN